jgi:CubicO group peptidase (beta-lactamase class C family)
LGILSSFLFAKAVVAPTPLSCTGPRMPTRVLPAASSATPGKEVVPQSWIELMATPSPTAKGYGYYCWINHVVETEPEFGAMGFKGQFITVLPKENAVVVMTSILPTDGGLRDATYLNRLCQFSRQQSMGNVAARGIAVRRLRGSRGQ